VRKFNLRDIIDLNYDFKLTKKQEKNYLIKQQDNPLFRQIRLITKDSSRYNPYVIFVNAKGGQSYEVELSKIVLDGIKINGTKYLMSERSASMVRTGILSFVNEKYIKELEMRITMDITFEKIVLSKYYAYRGLMFSSCHMIENWIPKIIIIPDYYRIIPNQKIKYVYDNESEFIDKDGNQRKWKQKDIAEKIQDIEINVFDGCGIHHPSISKYAEEYLIDLRIKELEERSKTDKKIELSKEINIRTTSILWRLPYIKGVTHEIDYTTYFKEHGINYIADVWGEKHSVDDEMIIMTESMYKGIKYFYQDGTINDWNRYWELFKKYQHCVGLAKWNFSIFEEPVFTRGNYQILQDLELNYDDFAKLANDSINWINKIIDGDPIYTYCFLGLFSNKHGELNNYTKAILKNPEMLKEYGVRNYLISLVQKYKDEMKAGKLWLKSCFKFLSPDMIMLLEWIGGLEVKGSLESDEFFTFGVNGIYNGEYLIERNPHICKSEHTILKAVTNKQIEKYCEHLSNVCMINSKSITPQRLNGADMDGDLVLVVDNEIIKSGVDREVSVVMDIDDKITALAEEDTAENRLALVLRTMNSLIGETSNCATGYHNKMPKTIEQKKKYESYIDLLSVINGKAIDYAKTGVLFNIPRHIAKYSKPLPYFMKYANNYYNSLAKFSKANSNMNRLCFELEKWDRKIRFKRTYKNFDYQIMINKDIEIDQKIYKKIEDIFLKFCKEMNELSKDQAVIRKYGSQGVSKEDTSNFVLNWREYYKKYSDLCAKKCPDKKMLANIAVQLCYISHPHKNKKFMWIVAADGILENIKQVDIKLPLFSKYGDYEYLGKRYFLKEIDCKEMEKYFI
jgi:hypothetical protein